MLNLFRHLNKIETTKSKRMKTNLFKYMGLTGMLTIALSISTWGQSPKMLTSQFTTTDESFKQYQYPEWFRDAKFGIWAHWGPQAVPRQGDWYARNMYFQSGNGWETRYYEHHVKTYGHPSKFGYKDIIPLLSLIHI